MWVGWVIEGLLFSARLPPQLADLPVTPEHGKFCWALKLKQKNNNKKKKNKKEKRERKSTQTLPKSPASRRLL